jgi:hypothetical protein
MVSGIAPLRHSNGFGVTVLLVHFSWKDDHGWNHYFATIDSFVYCHQFSVCGSSQVRQSFHIPCQHPLVLSYTNHEACLVDISDSGYIDYVQCTKLTEAIEPVINIVYNMSIHAVDIKWLSPSLEVHWIMFPEPKKPGVTDDRSMSVSNMVFCKQLMGTS